MNSNPNISTDTNNIQMINSDISQNPQIISSTLFPKSTSKKESPTEEQNKIIEKEKDSVKIEEKKSFDNSILFKKDQNENIINSNLSNKSLSNYCYNPFLQKLNTEEKPEINTLTHLNKNINSRTTNDTKLYQNSKKNKSQLIRNSINALPKEVNTYSNNIIRINLVKSQNKNKRKTEYQRIDNKRDINISKNEAKTEIKTVLNKESSDTNDKKYKYILLIKKLAYQLKNKVKPPSKGYFYVSLIRTDKYLSKIKKIAKKMKKKTCPPTHGFFYTFLEKQKNYKLLVKKIASQLKKRINFPTCKIIKVYESYRILVKKIADSIKSSMQKKEKEDKSTPIIVEDNSKSTPIIVENKAIDLPIDIENNSNSIDEPKIIENNININNIDALNNDDIKKNNGEIADYNMDIEEENIEKKNNEPKESIIKSGFRALTYSKDGDPLPLSQKSNNYENGNDTFTKMDIIQEDISKSYEIKKNQVINFQNIENNDIIKTEEIDQLKKVEHNKKEPILPMALNTNFLEGEINQDINIEQNIQKEQNEKEKKEENNYEIKTNNIIINDKKEEENIQNVICQNKSDSKKTVSIPCSSKKNKKIQLSISVFKKEYFIENNERKIQNKTHTKNDINLNLNKLNNNNLNKNVVEETINECENEINEKISFSEIEITNSDFSNKFQRFLTQEKIIIKDNFPISLYDNSVEYFHKSHFWYLIICYILCQNKNNNLSLYSIIHLLEQYNIWSQDKNENIFNSIKEKINEYIEHNYPKDIIDQFLFMNKYKDLSQIFKKFEIEKKIYEYKEIKVDNINIINDPKNIKCECDLCINDKACFQKVCELNKNIINVVNENNICFEKTSPEELHKICQKNLIQKACKYNIFHKNEEIFFGKIPQKKISCFSKSKIICEEKPNIEFNYISNISNKIKEIIPENNPQNINNRNSIDNITEEKMNFESINTDESIENGGTSMINTKEEKFIEYEEEKKTFKHISKNKPKSIPEKDEVNETNSKKSEKIENGMIKSDKKGNKEKEENKEEEKEEKEEKEKDDIVEEESKINKTEKKNKKGKSRKRNNKKKDATKNYNSEEDENEEKKEESKEEKEEEEKSYKKKRKPNSNMKKRNKTKVIEKDKNELDEMLKEDKANDEKENEDELDNISKKKRTKSPNRKRYKKHYL